MRRTDNCKHWDSLVPFVHFLDFHFLFTPEVLDLYRYVVDIKNVI